MAHHVLFVLLLYCTSVLCEECVTENFEDGLNGFTSDNQLCTGMSAFNLGNYSSLELTGIHPKSATFLIPDESISCITTYLVPMVVGAAIEFNIYASGITSTDFLTILVNYGGVSAPVVATESLHNDAIDGWTVISLTLDTPDDFDGYVTLMGAASDGAIILIDSFRYIAPGYDAELCEIYADDVITTTSESDDPTVPTTITTISDSEETTTSIETMTDAVVTTTDMTTPASESDDPTVPTTITTISDSEETTTSIETMTDAVVTTTDMTTPAIIDEDSHCLTYNFEDEFEILFSTEKELCRGFEPWVMDHYNYTATERPNGESGTFIYPKEDLSCIASFLFPMEVGGIVELNVYMESHSEFLGSEQISVMVMQSIEDGIDVVTGTAGVSTLDANYFDGWRTIRMQLFGTESFNGYITMFGSAAENSTVLVDSFRYIPPTFEERYCYIYDSNAPVETTTEPIIESCVSYTIKEDFNDRFTSSQEICAGFAPWNLVTYISKAIPVPNEESEYAIAANANANCVSSFPFLMSPEGIIQVKVYMEPVDPTIDHIIVLAKKFASNGQDTVNGYVLHTPSEGDYEDGWQLLNITLNDFSSFYGYVTFFGAAAEGSTVLIDSFKYIPPYEEDC